MPEQESAQAVRFSSVNQEIEPEEVPKDVSALDNPEKDGKENLTPEAEAEIRNLACSLQQSRCQARRAQNFTYEPVSLPPSRVSQPL